MTRGPDKRQVGQSGETLAVKFLARRGYRILARNYRTPFGEIDLVARKGSETAFIEVRTRNQSTFGEPAESLTKTKIQHWQRSATAYLKVEGGLDQPYRFDFVGIDLSGPKPNISLIENIL